MCLAIPGKVIAFAEEGHFATVDIASVRRKVNIDLLQNEVLSEGDWVLIHVGFAMSKISEAEASEQLRVLSLLGEKEAVLEEVRGYQFGGSDDS
jgi:hydrogenase expression/formation protein HypC